MIASARSKKASTTRSRRSSQRCKRLKALCQALVRSTCQRWLAWMGALLPVWVIWACKAAPGEFVSGLCRVVAGVQVHGDVGGQWTEVGELVQGWEPTAACRAGGRRPAPGPAGCQSPSTISDRFLPCLPRSTGDGPATSPSPGALVMHPSTAICSRIRPTMRSSASSAIVLSWAKLPNVIHSSRRLRMGVAEQVMSAMPW